MLKCVKSVLIIEDSIDDQELYQRLLKKIVPNARIINCTDAKSALSLLSDETTRYSIVLLDYNLPGACGLSVLKELNDADKMRHGPIIMLTGQGNEDVAVECLGHGARDYITKQRLSVESLKRSMQNALDKHRAEHAARERDHELNVFAETLAHDLKAPLGRVMVYLRALGKKHNLSDDMYFQNIKEDVDYTLFFLKRLLEYTQNGRSNMQLQPVDLNQVVQKSIDNLECMIKEHDVDIHYENMPEVEGDEIALVQFFQNMISNAIKYNKNKPEIKIDWVKKHHKKHILIHDNGVGIPPEKSKEIFEPFKRLCCDGEEHMGLGLALCHKIARQHKGDVFVKPRTEGGSTFCLSL